MEQNQNILAAALTAFTPVPVRYRRDGWTPERQRAFVAALLETRCVLKACRQVGKSPQAAYKLYRHPEAAGLRAAWESALVRRAPSADSSTCARSRRLRTSRSSSTSEPSTSAPSPPPRRAAPAYSLAGFVRAARRARPAGA